MMSKICSWTSWSAVVLAALALLPAQAVPAPVPENFKARWEYATLRQSQYGVALELPDKVLKADTCGQLINKLGGESTRNDSTAVLNVLGAEGWELVSHSMDLKEQNHVWTFKRRK